MALPNKYQRSDDLISWLALLYDEISTAITGLASLVVRVATLEDRSPVQTASVATTSGTSVSLITTIPSWARRVIVRLSGVSLSGTSSLMLQIGPSGGLVTSGYSGSVVNFQDAVVPQAALNTNGFRVANASVAANTIDGIGVFELHDLSTNTWIFSFCGARKAGTANVWSASGSIALSGALTQISVASQNTTDTLDAGSGSARYEY
jgi:hypothetical protein